MKYTPGGEYVVGQRPQAIRADDKAVMSRNQIKSSHFHTVWKRGLAHGTPVVFRIFYTEILSHVIFFVMMVLFLSKFKVFN